MAEPTQQDIAALTDAIKNLTRSFGGTTTRASSSSSTSRPGSSSSGGGRSLQSLYDELGDAEKGVKKLAKNSSLLAAATIKVASDMKILSQGRQILLLKDLIGNSNKLLKENINPNFKAVARSMNMLKEGADEFRDGLDSADFAKLSMAVGNTSDTIKKANARAEELIKTIEAQVDDAGRASIASIRRGGGSAMAQVARIKSAGVLGLDSDANQLPEMVSGGLQKIMDDLKKQLEEQGIVSEELTASGDELIETFDKLNDETERVNKTFVDTAKKHISVTGQLSQTTQVLRQHMHNFAGAVLTAATNLGSFHNLKEKSKGLFTELSNFNIANIADSFMGLQFRSIRLGMSFAETTELYKQNARVLSIYGKDNFANLLGGLSGTFEKYGYTFKQGAALIGPAIQNAVMSGVNVSNQAEFTNYMDQSLRNAQTMAVITGKMPEEIFKLQQGVLESEAVFKNLAGMDKQRRAAYAQEIRQTVDRLVLDGMEYEAAAEVVKLQTQAARAPIREKFEKAAFGMIGSRMAGMSAQETARLSKLERKTFRTGEEEAEMLRLQQQRAGGLERRLQAENARTGGEAFAFAFQKEMIEGKMFGGPAVEAAQRAAMRREAGMGITPEQAATAAARGAGDPRIAAFGQVVNQISSLLSNAFVGAAAGAVLGLGSVAITAAKAAWALKHLGALGGAGAGALAGGGTILGKAGKFGGSVLKGGLAGLALGLGGNLLGAAIGGQWGGALSGAATGAGLGATIGSVIPGVGTAIGAAAGGLIGGGVGYFTSPGSTTGPGGVNTSTLAAESMQSLSNQTVTVTDKEANMNLQAIAASMNEAVILLRAMVPGGTVATRGSTFQVPSAAEFVTGNG